ncbi:MAG: NADH(P)-binding protein [Planctomycetota bacterium]|nr:MAG: NADH(P)-binding protein [Planctomycetota bacterium]
MKILVTGGAGFLGRHVVARLIELGDEPLVLSRDPARAAESLPPAVRCVAGDLTQPDALVPILAAERPEAVIHCAAVVVNDSPSLVGVNVGGARRLVEQLTTLDPPPRLVHVSTFSVEDPPPTEYSESKLAAEEVVRESGLPFVIARPALIYGPGDSTNTPDLVARVADGNHWIPDGGRVQIQPVFVGDVAAALVECARRGGIEGRTYRLGGPTPISVHDFRAAVRDASGGNARLRTLPLFALALVAPLLKLAGKHGPAGVVAFHRRQHAVDIHAAQRDLDYQPRALSDGLALTFDPLR